MTQRLPWGRATRRPAPTAANIPAAPITPPDAPDPAFPVESGEAAAHLMGRISGITAEVRALLQERQDRRKAELDAHRREVQFKFAVGDEVQLDTEHTPLPSRSMLFPRRSAVGRAPSRYSPALRLT